MPINIVERYDSTIDTWHSFPSLNLARSLHSSCTIGNTLYVIGGRNSESKDIKEIEKLDNIDASSGFDVLHWVLI